MVSEALTQAAEARGIAPEKAELIHQQRGLTAAAIRTLPEAQLRSVMRRLESPDSPHARLAWRKAQARGDNGRIPENALLTAMRELDSLRARAPTGLVAGIPAGRRVAPAMLAIAEVAGLEARSWQPLGPVNIGGRTRALVISPDDSNTIWAASVGGGIWRSDDAGASWSPVDDFMANLAVTSLVIDPNDANHLFAGTGEGFGNLDELRGAGIFETRDGRRWHQISETSTADYHAVNRLAMSADGATLLAATSTGLFRSDDPARVSWTRVITGQGIADVKFHPSDASLAVAGSRRSGRAWYTTDGGVTWQDAAAPEASSGRVELCYAAADPTTVYASTDNAWGTIWRSTDGGATYAARGSLNPDGDAAYYLGEQGWYDNVIWAADPTDKDFVIVGGIDLWKSLDGGASLEPISSWFQGGSAHGDHHAIVADPGYDGVVNRRVWFGNDGGIFFTDDVTSVGSDPDHVTGWEFRGNGYAVTQFYGIAANAATGMIVGGTQDNGTLAYDINQGDLRWHSIFGGDGGFCASDRVDANYFYGEYTNLNIHRSADGAAPAGSTGNRYISGRFWNPITEEWEWKPFPFRIPDAGTDRALFIAPFALDPDEPNRILAGSRSLWRTNDARTPNTNASGPRWKRIRTPAAVRISAIAIDPSNSDNVWLGYENGEVFRSINATSDTPAWQPRNGQDETALAVARMCTRLLVSPHDSRRVLASFAGFQHDNLWLTADGGETWRAIGGLPAAPLRALAIHPVHPDFFYVGTEVGIFASEDAGVTWSPTNEGPANVSVDDLIWMDENLICATHGRGVFMIDLADL